MFIENGITKILDGTLEMENDERCKKFAPWCVIYGLPGFGKTASINAWLEHHKYKNLVIDATTLRTQSNRISYIDFEGLKFREKDVATFSKIETKEKDVVTIFSSNVIDCIDSDTIVVIENYDKSSQEVRNELMKYIHYHQLVDLRVDDNSDRTKVINPRMLVVVIDTAQLVTIAPLTVDELKLFGLDEYIKYIN